MSDRIEKLKKMLENEPNDPFCLYGLAQEYTKTGELDRAVELYERTIEIDPAHSYAYFHLARVLEQQDEIDRARQTLQAGLERARAADDQKAAEEIQAFLDALD